MELYFGTYTGQIISLTNFPTSFKSKPPLQLSQGSIRSLYVSGNRIFLGTFQQQFKAIDIETKLQIFEDTTYKGIIQSIIGLKDMIVLGYDDGCIQFWDVKDWVVIKQIRQHHKPIQDLTVDAEHKVLISASKDKLVFWSADQLRKVYEYKLPFGKINFYVDIHRIVLKEDFSSIFLVSQTQIHQFSCETNTQIATIKVNQKIQTCHLFKNYLIVGTSKGQINIWQLDKYQYKISFKAHQTRVKVATFIQLQEISYLFTASSEGNVKAWDVLQFLKEIDNISQDYSLQGLAPLLQINLNHRILCIGQNDPQNNVKKSKRQKIANKITKKKQQLVSQQLLSKKQNVLAKQKQIKKLKKSYKLQKMSKKKRAK